MTAADTIVSGQPQRDRTGGPSPQIRTRRPTGQSPLHCSAPASFASSSLLRLFNQKNPHDVLRTLELLGLLLTRSNSSSVSLKPSFESNTQSLWFAYLNMERITCHLHSTRRVDAKWTEAPSPFSRRDGMAWQWPCPSVRSDQIRSDQSPPLEVGIVPTPVLVLPVGKLGVPLAVRDSAERCVVIKAGVKDLVHYLLRLLSADVPHCQDGADRSASDARLSGEDSRLERKKHN